MSTNSSVGIGKFSCAQLEQQCAALEAMGTWGQQIEKDYVPHSETISAVLQNQSTAFDVLTDEVKDYDFRVYWVRPDCEDRIIDCPTGCETEIGDRPESACQDYALNICFGVRGFSVSESDLRGSKFTFDQVVARKLAEVRKAAAEELNRRAIGFLEQSEGVNTVNEPNYGVTTVSPYTTLVNPDILDPNWYGYVQRVVMLNQMNSPYFVHFSNVFHQSEFNYFYNQLNCDKQDQYAKFDLIPRYIDLWHGTSVTGKDKSFLVEPNAVVLASRSLYPTAPTETNFGSDTKTLFQIPVDPERLPGIVLSVEYSVSCEAHGPYSLPLHNYKFFFEGGLYLNPAGCDEGSTGVLSFTLDCNVDHEQECVSNPIEAPEACADSAYDPSCNVLSLSACDDIDTSCKPVSDIAYRIQFNDVDGADLGGEVLINGLPNESIATVYGGGTYAAPDFSVAALLAVAPEGTANIKFFKTITDNCGTVSEETEVACIDIVIDEPAEGEGDTGEGDTDTGGDTGSGGDGSGGVKTKKK